MPHPGGARALARGDRTLQSAPEPGLRRRSAPTGGLDTRRRPGPGRPHQGWPGGSGSEKVGGLAAGKVADLGLFDPSTVATRPPEYAHDFPSNSRCLISKPEGIVAMFGAGTQVYEYGAHTGQLPERILRSYG